LKIGSRAVRNTVFFLLGGAHWIAFLTPARELGMKVRGTAVRFRDRLIRAVAHVDASSPLASATLKTCESSGEWPTSDFFDAKFRVGADWCVARGGPKIREWGGLILELGGLRAR
jgi:hypothetical protein